MPNQKPPIRHIDFSREIIIDLHNPDVLAAYQTWAAASKAINEKPIFDVTLQEEQAAERLYKKVIQLAQQVGAISVLT